MTGVKIVPGLFDIILRRDMASRIKNIQYMGNVKSSDGITVLIKCMGDENAEIRRAASSALEQHWMTGNSQAIAALTKALGDPNEDVRVNVAMGLGEFISRSTPSKDCEEAKQAMIRQLMEERDVRVIKGVVVGLAHIQDGALIGPMVDAFRTKDKKIVIMAIDAIDDFLPTQARSDMKKALRSIL
jgi:HEAT repeat protein